MIHRQPSLLLASAFALLAGSTALGKSGTLVGPRMIVVKVGQSTLVHLPRKPLQVAVDDPSVASLQALPRNTLRITGKRIGDTRISGQDVARHRIAIQVKVLPGAAPRKAPKARGPVAR
jgi:Flp pilus assembly secretin CpaC